MPYTHYTIDERNTLPEMEGMALPKSSGTIILGKHPSSIYRELNQNRTGGEARQSSVQRHLDNIVLLPKRYQFKTAAIYRSYRHISYLSILSLIHPLPDPVSSLAGRAPPCGGIAHPKGKHSHRMAVLCQPSADLPAITGFKQG
jgi:hypothetical protein